MFDFQTIFEDWNIPYQTGGNNVSTGWIEITCPFCSDHSFHCGINLNSGLFHCWICGSKGHAKHLLKELLGITYNRATLLLEEHENIVNEQISSKIIKNTSIKIPKEFSNILPDLHKNYLLKRKFNPSYLQNKYKIMASHQIGRFSFRLITPVFINGQLVNFTARDVSGQQKVKYLHLHNEEAVIPMKNCLFNIDTVHDKIIICEGVFDVFRIGDGAVATMGIEYTPFQLNLLLEKELKEAYVLFDPDANKKAEKLANVLSSFIPKVEILTIDVKDPAELSDQEALELKKEINF